MFPHTSTFLAIVVAVAANARMERHLHIRKDNNNTQTPSQCNTGQVKCCDSMYNATDENVGTLLDQLSVPYDLSDNVWINCTPFNIYGVGEAAGCQQQPVCCTNNDYSGFINVGCSPFDLN